MKKTFKIAEVTEELEFNLGEDDYEFRAYAPEEIPANVLVEYSELVSAGKLHEAHKKFFTKVLHPESAIEFEYRLNTHEKGKTITLSTMIQVAEWLVTEYSRFPTQSARR